jgi:hypothetical protein
MKINLIYPLISIAALLGATCIYLANEVHELSQMSLVWYADEAIVADAKRRLATIEHTDVNTVMKRRYPVVIRFPEKRCVALQLKRTSTGTEPVYCYRSSDDALVEEFVEEI